MKNKYNSLIYKRPMSSDEYINVGIGILFGYLIYSRFINPVVIHGPNSADIINRVYEVDNKKYKLKPYIYPSIVKFK